MTSARGLSGAQVFVTDGVAIKVGYDDPNRVIEQGQWLIDNQCPGLPEVVILKPRGYVMEKLDAVPTAEVNLEHYVEILDRDIWSKPAVYTLDPTKTVHKVSLVLSKYAPHLLEAIADDVASLLPTIACLTHGDPTAENIMARDGRYVVIDPIPASEAVPDDLAVDIGKILQSALGWEAMKGEERAKFDHDDVADLFGDELFVQASTWCLVHFVRTLPYAGEEVRSRVIGKLEELLGL